MSDSNMFEAPLLSAPYCTPPQSLNERSQALAAQMLAAIDSNVATPVTQALAAWDLHPAYTGWLGDYEVGAGGARLVQQRHVPCAERQAVLNELSMRGTAVGRTYRGGPATWCLLDAQPGGVWSATGQKLLGSTAALTLGFRSVARCDINAVESFVSRDDLGHSGIKLLLTDQCEVVVIEQHSLAAQDAHSYDREQAAEAGTWASALGCDLAAWLGVPHQDEVG